MDDADHWNIYPPIQPPSYPCPDAPFEPVFQCIINLTERLHST